VASNRSMTRTRNPTIAPSSGVGDSFTPVHPRATVRRSTSLIKPLTAQIERSRRLHHVRLLNEVRYVAQNGQHLDGLTRTGIGPTGMGYDVPHAHERAPD
jgi:hypothetical protein